MKITAYVHRYPPLHNAGAEWMLHHLLRHLVLCGHEVRVATSHPVGIGVFEGVTISPQANLRELHKWYGWADVILTHLDVTTRAAALAQRHRKPLIHLVHNHRQLVHHHVSPAAALVVFNSWWLSRAVDWPGPSMVLHPPVPPAYYRQDGPHDRVLMSNLIAAKGSLLAFALAEALPNLPFLFVRGAYGRQEPPPELPNIEVVTQRPDMRAHLARARLVLMPSSYESWGRVAVEAAAAGVPTIASRAPGLVEALAGHGTHLDVAAEQWGPVQPTPDTVQAWAAAVRAHWRYGEDRRAELRAYADRLWELSLAQLAELEARLGKL